MKKYLLTIILISITSLFCFDGFYKDIFMDGGCNVYSNDFFYSADSLGLEWEYLATETQSIQDNVIISNEWDSNGRLLYPDGEPRFRTIYTNGGSATNHGNSMGSVGRQTVRDYYYAGGSYTGSCAGAFISSISYRTTGTWDAYYHIWPGRTTSTGLSDTPTGHFIEEDSPLLEYSDFGGDMYIDDVYHNGGCYANTYTDWPTATEVLLRYDYPSRDMHNEPSCWAYKEDSESGRVVVIGSHPENMENGERMWLMGAIVQYAIAGQGDASLKATLVRNEWREMNMETADEMPEFTKIGDKQYHHFAIDITEYTDELRIELDGEDGYHFNLYAHYGDFAFQSTADYADSSENADKILTIPFPETGLLYISVELYTTVEITMESWGQDYTGNLEILDGLPYSIKAGWDSVTNINEYAISDFDYPEITASPNPFKQNVTISCNIDIDNLMIFDNSGRMIRILSNNGNSLIWDGKNAEGNEMPDGIYFVKPVNNKSNSSIPIVKLK